MNITYNQYYIDSFQTTSYEDYLKDPQKLKRLAHHYLLQYKEGSNAQMLAFKESLDHYVLMKLTTDFDYINQQQFQSYIDYILYIGENKITTGKFGNAQLEFNTNIVFRKKEIKDIIFSRFDPYKRKEWNEKIQKNKKIIEELERKMDYHLELKQEELDFLGDYIYSSRDVTSNVSRKFIHYLFYELNELSDVRASIPIMGAFFTFLPSSLWSLWSDQETANARMFIADKDYNNRSVFSHSVSKRGYCSFGRKYIEKTDLFTDQSLMISRGCDYLDLYFWLFAGFHELSHQYQKNLMKKSSYSSSGLSYVIRLILSKEFHDYEKNHDSNEIEMEADEQAWKLCAHFLLQQNQNNENKMYDRVVKCHRNEQEVRARRAFSLKEEEKRNFFKVSKDKIYYAIYDIEHLSDAIRRKPKYLDKYPVLKRFMDRQGELKATILFTDLITTNDSFGIDENYAGLQFATYLLDYQHDKILDVIKNYSVNEEHANFLITNLCNVMNQNILRIQDVDHVKFENYKNTHHKYDLENESDAIYDSYFKKNAFEIHHTIQIMGELRKKIPSLEVGKKQEEQYCESNFRFLFHKLKNYNRTTLGDICRDYDRSNNPFLGKLSSYIRSDLANQTKTSTTNKQQDIFESKSN